MPCKNNIKMKTKLEIINMVANHYNETNRAYDDGKCSYLTTDGRMCAVGMCMTEEQLENFKDFQGDVETLEERIGVDINKLLKEEFKGHSTKFWSELQWLHDNSNYWDDDGLTEGGRNQYNSLLEIFGDDK